MTTELLRGHAERAASISSQLYYLPGLRFVCDDNQTKILDETLHLHTRPNELMNYRDSIPSTKWLTTASDHTGYRLFWALLGVHCGWHIKSSFWLPRRHVCIGTSADPFYREVRNEVFGYVFYVHQHEYYILCSEKKKKWKTSYAFSSA